MFPFTRATHLWGYPSLDLSPTKQVLAKPQLQLPACKEEKRSRAKMPPRCACSRQATAWRCRARAERGRGAPWPRWARVCRAKRFGSCYSRHDRASFEGSEVGSQRLGSAASCLSIPSRNLRGSQMSLHRRPLSALQLRQTSAAKQCQSKHASKREGKKREKKGEEKKRRGKKQKTDPVSSKIHMVGIHRAKREPSSPPSPPSSASKVARSHTRIDPWEKRNVRGSNQHESAVRVCVSFDLVPETGQKKKKKRCPLGTPTWRTFYNVLAHSRASGNDHDKL